MRLYSRNLAAVLMGLALLAFQIDSDAQSRGGSQSSRSSRPSTSASSSSSSASRSSAPSSKSSASSSRPSTSASASRPSSSASSQDSKPKADISPANRNPSKPSNNVTRPSSKPSGSVSKPSGNTKPSGNNKPSGNVTKPSGNNKPSGDLNRPSGNHQRPSGTVSRPSGNPQRPSGHRPPGSISGPSRPSGHRPPGNISGPSRPSGPAPVMKPGHKPQNHWKPSGHYYGHRIKVLPARARSYVYSGRTYYVLDDIWYRLHNGYYVVSRPPVGTVLAANLIADIVWTAVRFANNVVPQASYFYQDGVFYTLGADGRYYVIVPPIGALIERLPDDYEVISIGGNEYYRVDNTIYQLTINDGQPYFEVVGQVD